MWSTPFVARQYCVVISTSFLNKICIISQKGPRIKIRWCQLGRNRPSRCFRLVLSFWQVEPCIPFCQVVSIVWTYYDFAYPFRYTLVSGFGKTNKAARDICIQVFFGFRLCGMGLPNMFSYPHLPSVYSRERFCTFKSGWLFILNRASVLQMFKKKKKEGSVPLVSDLTLVDADTISS